MKKTEQWGAAYELKLNELYCSKDTMCIEARVYDSQGIFCPDAKSLVEFEAIGDYHLIDNLGTWDGSRKIQLYNGRAMIKMTGKACVLSEKSDGLKTDFLTITR